MTIPGTASDWLITVVTPPPSRLLLNMLPVVPDCMSLQYWKPRLMSPWIYKVTNAYHIRWNIGGTLIWWIAKILCFVDLILAVDDYSPDSNTLVYTWEKGFCRFNIDSPYKTANPQIKNPLHLSTLLRIFWLSTIYSVQEWFQLHDWILNKFYGVTVELGYLAHAPDIPKTTSYNGTRGFALSISFYTAWLVKGHAHYSASSCFLKTPLNCNSCTINLSMASISHTDMLKRVDKR